MNKKVNILMSTYNGEEYLEEQIESILGQDYKDIEIYIRDDGSIDNTVSILKKYLNYPKFHIIFGDNIGFIDSFIWLICNCNKADYYAFCDQDDIWEDIKISRAIEILEKDKSSVPTLYFSNYEYFNNENISFGYGYTKEPKPSFQNSLVDCITLGFNSVFNDVARELILNNTPKKSCGHDWWLYLICAGMGNVVYDDCITVRAVFTILSRFLCTVIFATN